MQYAPPVLVPDAQLPPGAVALTGIANGGKEAATSLKATENNVAGGLHGSSSDWKIGAATSVATGGSTMAASHGSSAASAHHGDVLEHDGEFLNVPELDVL